MADWDALRADPYLGALLGGDGGAQKTADAARAAAEAVRPPNGHSATAAVASSAAAATTGGGGGLEALWRPLTAAVGGGFDALGGSSADAGRLLRALLGVRSRLDAQLQPGGLYAEARAAMGPEALLAAMPKLRARAQRDAVGTLLAAAEASAARVADGGAGGASELCAALEKELRRGEGVPPLQAVAGAAAAQAVRMLSARLEGVVRAEGAEEAAAANARVLGAVREVRARVAELLAGGLDEDATRPLREALGSLQPVCVALANPDTPLPEEKREAAALALKQLLRLEIIDDA